MKISFPVYFALQTNDWKLALSAFEFRLMFDFKK